MTERDRSEFGSEYLLIFVGYSSDADDAADVLVGLEQPLQRELDKLRKVNPNIPFSRVKLWKWDSDAVIIKGGQNKVVTPHLDRANIAVFVFNWRVGEAAWDELNHAINRNPSIAVLPFFRASPPPQESMNDVIVAGLWLDLLKKSLSLAEGWTDPDTKALTPLPKYENTTHLEKLAIDRLISEMVRLASIYASEVEKSGRPSIVHPSAHSPSHDKVVLGYEQNTSEPFVYEGAGHILSIVPSGRERYGDTVVRNLNRYLGATLILDPTGEIYRATAEKRAGMSDVLKLDPWSLVQDSRSGSLNPIDTLLQMGLSVDDTAKLLTELMIPYTEYRYRRRELLTSDPFWTNLQRKFLTALIHLAISESENNEAILTRVRNILHEDDLVYSLAVRLDTKGKEMDPELRQELAHFLQQPDNTRLGIIAGVSQFFMALSSSVAQLLTNVSSIDTKKWLDNDPVTVYLIGPPAGISAFDSIYRAWLGSLLLPILVRPGKKDKPVLLIMDIDETFEQWHGIANAFTQGRNCQIWTIVSDVSDLEKAFEDSPISILNSFSVIQAFRPNNFAAATALSRVIGMPAEKVLELSNSEMVLTINGSRPVVVRSHRG